MAERAPRGRADDAVGGQAVAALEALDRALGAGAEDAVGGDAEAALERDDRGAVRDVRGAPRAGWRGGRGRSRAARSAAQVAGPTIPSAVRPWRRWKRLTARLVPGPKMPSACSPSQRWTLVTCGPCEPRLSAASAGTAGREQGDGRHAGEDARAGAPRGVCVSRSVQSVYAVWVAYEVS